MKKFKTKRKYNNFIIYIGIFLISIVFSMRYLYKHNKINKNTIVDKLINNNFKKNENIFDSEFMLKYAFSNINDEEEKVLPVIEEEKEEVKVEVKKKEEDILPIIYIYNTHQEEKYQSNYMNGYNITSSVLQASNILSEYLKDNGINSIVEKDSITDKLHSLNLKYGSSYRVSRMFLESAYNNNKSLKYFIDIHRDSSKYDATTTEIDGEKYARILFVIGLEHDNYLRNLSFAEKLRDKVIEFNPNLFRGIMKKSGKNVNGIYNQDFNEKCILIEVGGQYNSIDEVNNTLRVLAKILANFIKEDNNE